MNGFYEPSYDASREYLDVGYLAKRRILVTGANGLIASHIAYALLALKRDTGIDIELTLVSKSPPVSWLQETFLAQGVRFLAEDLSLGLPAQIASANFNLIIHAATYGQPRKFLDNALETIQLNSNLTEALLKKAVSDQADFLYMSSSEIYGSPPPGFSPLDEEFPGMASPIDHRAVYTSSKRFGETLCKVYGEKFGIRTRIARISSVYGPGVRLNDDRAINIFIRAALANGEIRLQDMGLQVRRWLDISDATRMLMFILTKSKALVYNVAGDDLKSIAELAHEIQRQVNCKVSFPEKTAESYEIQGAPALIDIDIQRIRAEANITSLKDLSEIVEGCVAWSKALMSGKL